MEFVTSFVNSLGNLSWLKAQRKNDKRAWRYFLLLSLILTVLTLLPGSIIFPRELKKIDGVVKQMPAFTAHLTKGELVVQGITQPFVYSNQANDFVVVIATATSTELSSYIKNKNQNALLIARDKMELYDGGSGATRAQTWSGLPDTTITREALNSAIQKFSQWQWLLPMLLIAVIVSYGGMMIGKLILMVLVITLVQLIGMLLKRPWRWRELFVVGLFGITLPAVIELAVGWAMGGPAYIFFLAYLAFMLAVVLTRDLSEFPAKSQE